MQTGHTMEGMEGMEGLLQVVIMEDSMGEVFVPGEFVGADSVLIVATS